MLLRKIAVCLFLLAPSLLAQQRRPVLMISIDGLRPDYVTHADEHHLKIPTLRGFLADGTYADGVVGVFPTVTYPSHTTLVTGVWPAEHGILNNTRFDPERQFAGAWYWYADQIKVPTLWSAAKAAGLQTASVSWPVTVDSTDIDFLIPEYWRGTSAGGSSNSDDEFMMNAVSRPDGEVKRISERVGTPYMMGNNTTAAGDEIRTLYSLDILKQHQPEFMTIHLSSLDEEEHLHGPFSDEADADLEKIDGMVARLISQERMAHPDAVIVIVSDHGFAHVDHALNLYIPFLQAGLIQSKKDASGTVTVTSWSAEPWGLGAMAAIILHDPSDTATYEKVRAILTSLAADPSNGIEAILDQKQVQALGGTPQASFVVALKAGYVPGAAMTGALVSEAPLKGTHGYNPQTTPEMHASFFAIGPGIRAGKDLGTVDMRQIAPTVAAILQISLPTAVQPALDLH
jgi:predicted AlkP superfamily pyrophosphatase or phosphodiesterase